MKNKPLYIRKETYPIDTILQHLHKDLTMRDTLDLGGDIIRLKSDRYITFKFKGTKCVCCGLEGSFFAKEKTNAKYPPLNFHLNLYGYKDGKEIMLTKDHIHPKSKGGSNTLDNYQTMCAPCNERKGSKI